MLGRRRWADLPGSGDGDLPALFPGHGPAGLSGHLLARLSGNVHAMLLLNGHAALAGQLDAGLLGFQGADLVRVVLALLHILADLPGLGAALLLQGLGAGLDGDLLAHALGLVVTHLPDLDMLLLVDHGPVFLGDLGFDDLLGGGTGLAVLCVLGSLLGVEVILQGFKVPLQGSPSDAVSASLQQVLGGRVAAQVVSGVHGIHVLDHTVGVLVGAAASSANVIVTGADVDGVGSAEALVGGVLVVGLVPEVTGLDGVVGVGVALDVALVFVHDPGGSAVVIGGFLDVGRGLDGVDGLLLHAEHLLVDGVLGLVDAMVDLIIIGMVKNDETAQKMMLRFKITFSVTSSWQTRLLISSHCSWKEVEHTLLGTCSHTRSSTVRHFLLVVHRLSQTTEHLGRDRVVHLFWNYDMKHSATHKSLKIKVATSNLPN